MATLTLSLPPTAIDLTELLPVTFTKPGLTEEEYFELCAEFDDYFVEYTADGTVIIMPGTDPETSEGVLDVNFQLTTWARQDGRGRVTGPDASFFFPNGPAASPTPHGSMRNDGRQPRPEHPAKECQCSPPNL